MFGYYLVATFPQKLLPFVGRRHPSSIQQTTRFGLRSLDGRVHVLFYYLTILFLFVCFFLLPHSFLKTTPRKDGREIPAGEHKTPDPETGDARGKAADAPVRLHGVGEENVPGEQGLSPDNGLRGSPTGSAVTVSEKTHQKGH